MSDYVVEINRVLAVTKVLPYGQTCLAMVEEAVRLADIHNDLPNGFRARRRLTEVALFSGSPDVMLVAISWCLAQCDRNPEQFKEKDLLWEYKWVAAQLPDFPQVTRVQIEAMLADMERRYRRCGSTMHGYHHKRRSVLKSMGDLTAAAAADAELARTKRDWLSDCLACVMNSDVEYKAALGRDEDALAAAAPILAGRNKCVEVPHGTYGEVLLPLLRLGRPAEAMSYHRKGYRLIASNPRFLRHIGQHLAFLALTDNLAKASSVFEKNLAGALTAVSGIERFEFYRAARFLLERLTVQGQTSLKLRLADAFPPRPAKGRYAVADLAEWFMNELTDLAKRFDARNGNDAYGKRIAELQQWHTLVTPHPLTNRKASPE